MPKLTFDVPDFLAQAVQAQAISAGKTIPEFLAGLVASHVQPTWTDAYKTEVLGRWCGEPPERCEPALPEYREDW